MACLWKWTLGAGKDIGNSRGFVFHENQNLNLALTNTKWVPSVNTEKLKWEYYVGTYKRNHLLSGRLKLLIPMLRYSKNFGKEKTRFLKFQIIIPSSLKAI